MPPGEAASAPASSRTSLRRARVALLAAVVLAYANTFSVPFVFDDAAAITQNSSLASFATALSPPPGLSVTGRPLVNLSLAVNHAISGDHPWSYHALNLALHLACALTLFGLVRLTLARLRFADPVVPAFATALLWAVHPLQTGAVTYVMQRSELLVSLCYLLTLYCFVRGANASARGRWAVASVLACGLGMTAKEVMATAPLVVLLYDRTFFAGSFRAALRTGPGYYAGLAATWVVLAGLVLGTENRGASAGFSSGVPWTGYALTQLYAIPHYLRLAVWPSPLVFDYGNALIRDPARILPGALALAALLIATIAALRRWPAFGFGGAVFFLLLAPSSSVVPIATQTIAEHRSYLALSVPVLFAVVALHRWLARRALLVCLAIASVLGAATLARNAAYRDELTLWRDTAEKVPASARAHYNVGVMLALASDRAGALREFTTALHLDPGHDSARHALGVVLVELGRPAAALPYLEAAARRYPASAAAHYDLANALVQLGRFGEAATHYAESVHCEPGHAIVHYNLGNALAQLGRYREALVQLEEAARLDPTDASARNNAARVRDYLRDLPR